MSAKRLGAAWIRLLLVLGYRGHLQMVAIALILATASGLVVTVQGLVLQGWLLVAGGLLLMLGALLTFRILLADRVFALSMPYSSLYWKKALYRLTVLQENVVEQVVKLHVVALRDGVDRLQLAYRWTGSGKATLSVESEGCYLLAKRRADGWQHYEIEFERFLRVGEARTVVVRQTMVDEAGSFEPILTKTVDQPIGQLTLTVVPSKDPPPTYVTCYEYWSDSPRFAPLSYVREPWDPQAVEKTWVIRSPRLGRAYGISWGHEKRSTAVTLEDKP